MARLTNDVTMLALEKALDGAAARQLAVADNLANAETPGYRPRRVEFQQQLRAALREQESVNDEASRADVAGVAPRRHLYTGPALRRDGNAVDLETELGELAESGLQFQAVTRLLSRKLAMLRSVATEGGKA